MKKIINLLLIFAVFFVNISCASSNSVEKNQTTETLKPETEVSNHPFKIANGEYSTIMDSSIVSKGNNARLKTVLEKAKNGEKLYIAAIGGSVTEGAGPANFKDGYAYQFVKKFKDVYTPDNGKNVYFCNAGLSGTPSPLGLVRYQQDVVKPLGANPDLLIIEFAVNDGGEPTYCRAFEELIRNALASNDDCAVIVLFAAATYQNTQTQMTPFANFYQVPMVSISDAIKTPVAKGLFTNKDFFTDIVHPTKEGHEFMADCLMTLLAKIDNDELNNKNELPQDVYRAPSFAGFKQILGDDENVKITKGGFSSTDPQCQTLKKTNKSNFTTNWYHSPSNDSESFRMEIDCKNLIFVYKENGSWTNIKGGKAEVYVDGKLKATYNAGKEGGWNNCITTLIIDEAESKKHTVEVKMAAGDEKKSFTIVAMGYSK